MRAAIDRYVDGLADKEGPRGLPRQFKAPDWDKLSARRVAKLTKGTERFDLGNKKLGLSATDPQVRAEIEALAAPGGPLADFAIKDVATFQRVQGSTGGYARYWVLADRGGKPAVLELGETIQPAPAMLEGEGSQPSGNQRLTSQTVADRWTDAWKTAKAER